jgi:uncharacterized protein YndB with AHSA1/START domain
MKWHGVQLQPQPDQDPCAIIAVRELEAPHELVFAVWTDPKHLAQW